MRPQTNILFPIEVINRELDFRLWLAALYAHPGCRIFIGQHDELASLSRRLRGGVYVGKNMFLSPFPASIARYKGLKAQGFTCVHLDEEGLAAGYDRASFEKYLAWRLDASVLENNDYVCTWGDAQREFYARHHSHPENVRTTGHPRFELYNREHRAYFQADADQIRTRFGSFILINTNLSHANDGLGIRNTFSGPGWYNHDDVDARLNHFAGWAHQTHILANTVKLVNAIAVRWPKETIVLRPHPSEGNAIYEAVFHDLQNVHVLHEGPVAPWLLACRLLIHHACTTAIEAHLADVPVVDYKSHEPDVLWRDENRMPERFGALCRSEAEVFRYIEGLAASPSPDLFEARLAADTQRTLANLTEPSFARLISVIHEAEATLPLDARGDNGGIRAAHAARRIRDSAKSLVRPLFPSRMAKVRFLTGVFYGFNEKQIGRRFDTIQKMTNRRISWDLLGDNVICVQAG